MRVAVAGAGAWGTALAHQLAGNGHGVMLWAREPDVALAINRDRQNPRFLPSIQIHPSVQATNEMGLALHGAEIIVYVAPSHVLREVVRAGTTEVGADALLVVATKGIERQSLALMTEVVSAECHGRGVVALSGPSFAMEVARGHPTAIVAASESPKAAEAVQRILSGSTLRIYTNDDVRGVELGGALKNVMAVATGIAEGLDLGLNSRAALITRGLAEMTRLGVALGARAATFAGLAGMGDLVLTCTGSLSRNRAVGLDVGKGIPLRDILAGRDSVAEGVINTESAWALARRERVDMPIVEAVHRILFENQTPRQAMSELMSRELRAEHDQ
ncbi:MAG: Glycerol-3-phosphate dehydrogenase [NAD(P)+] [Gemmatimonadaceae bacterium]|nr:Glycerol-3-phosphate dehydrogenase [NAD(P)+] [Gemmatimonadaceae bacterium]